MMQYLPWMESAGIEVTVAPLFLDAYVSGLQDNSRKLDDVAQAYAGRVKAPRGKPRVIKKLQERNAHEILNIFGIQPVALTANEAQYLVGLRTPDEIRNRLATARKEINRRLRSKGIRWADERKDAGDAW